MLRMCVLLGVHKVETFCFLFVHVYCVFGYVVCLHACRIFSVGGVMLLRIRATCSWYFYLKDVLLYFYLVFLFEGHVTVHVPGMFI